MLEHEKMLGIVSYKERQTGDKEAAAEANRIKNIGLKGAAPPKIEFNVNNTGKKV